MIEERDLILQSSVPVKPVSIQERLTSSLARISGILAPLFFLLLLSLLLARLSPTFATRDNLKQILVQAAVVAVLACGQTAVIISGNIDLSVGSVMAFAGVMAAQGMSRSGHLPFWASLILALPIALISGWMVMRSIRKLPDRARWLIGGVVFLIMGGVGGLIINSALLHFGVGIWGAVLLSCTTGLSAGIVTGLLTAYGRIPSFIVTLGMMGIAYGVGGIIAESKTVSGITSGYEVFGAGELFGTANRDGIPYPVLILVLVAVLMFLALTRTRWGRNLYAIGGNREASRLSGIPLSPMTVSVFALSGLLAGIAAVVNVSRTSVAQHSAGEGLELYAVAATVIGGTSLFGGQGGIQGTIVGALLMFTIRNGCDLLGVDSVYQRAVIGAVVILAVLYDRYTLPLVRHWLTPATEKKG